MGLGTNLARDFAPEHAQVIDDFKDQLIIALVKRLGGNVAMPVHEVDDTSNDLLAFNITDSVFNFQIQKKQ
jgi:hypothetical protein